jgi:polysaccharide deacetylase 2 family uncharacterized protein YibQ
VQLVVQVVILKSLCRRSIAHMYLICPQFNSDILRNISRLVVTGGVWWSVSAATMLSMTQAATTAANDSATTFVQPSYISIIIDDIGYKHGDQRFTQLPKEISFAILPHAHYSYDLGLAAGEQGRDVMLHLPLESIVPSGQLGDGALMTYMDRAELQETFASALASVPNVIGINNHMGSKFTQLSGPLDALMDLVARQQLFFIDSRTTPFSKVESIAQQKGIETARRNIFLDHVTSADFIERQFKQLIRQAQRNGHALAIGHPHDKTLAFLSQNLPLLKQHNIQLVGIQDYLYLTDTKAKTPNPAMQTEQPSLQTAPLP